MARLKLLLVFGIICVFSHVSLLSGQGFIRGDVNSDGSIDLADAISLLGYLFMDGTLSCLDAGDANDSGKIHLADPITILDYLFGDTADLPPPFPDCDIDPTPDDLGCAVSTCGVGNEAPSVVFIPLVTPADGYYSGDVALDFELSDPEGDAVDLTPYFFLDTGGVEELEAAVQLLTFNGVDWMPAGFPLPASAEGTKYRIIWDSAHDVRAGGPGDGIMPAGAWGLLLLEEEQDQAFRYTFRSPLDNAPPPGIAIESLVTESSDWLGGTALFGNVRMNVEYSCPVACHVEGRLFAQLEDAPEFQSVSSPVTLGATPHSQTVAFHWDTSQIPRSEDTLLEVRFIRSIQGQQTKGATVAASPFLIDNTTPQIEVLIPRGGEKLAGDVKAEFLLSHPVECETEIDMVYTDDLLIEDIDPAGQWLDHAKHASIMESFSAEPDPVMASPGGSLQRITWNSYRDTHDGRTWPEHVPYASVNVMLHMRTRNLQTGKYGPWSHTNIFELNQRWMSTVAGRDPLGDRGPAKNAKFNFSGSDGWDMSNWNGASLSIGSDGSLYIADSGNGRFRRISPRGIISTVAGNGEYGSTGDGGPAVEASFKLHEVSPFPSGICPGIVEGEDRSLYLVDSFSGRIRIVSPQGIIRNYFSSGMMFGIDITQDGTLFVVDWSGAPGSILRISPKQEVETFYEGGYGTDIALVSDGSVVMADPNARHVIRVLPDGQSILVAGGGSGSDGGPANQAALNSPVGVCIGPDDSVYIADAEDHRIRRVLPGPNGMIQTVAGTGTAGFSGDGGPATSAQLDSPLDVAMDANGFLYVADGKNQRIRRVSPEGIISTYSGGSVSVGVGPATETNLENPTGLAMDVEGNFYFADVKRNSILRITANGVIEVFAGTGARGDAGDGGPATEAELRLGFARIFPEYWHTPCVTVGPDGSVYFTDSGNDRIRRVMDGIITTVAAGISKPAGLAVAADGTVYFTSDRSIRCIKPDGTVETIAAERPLPSRILLTRDGVLYVSDTPNNHIVRIERDGTITHIAGWGTLTGDGVPAVDAKIKGPRGLALGHDGSLYFVESHASVIRRILPDGTLTTVAGTPLEWGDFSGDNGPALEAELSFFTYAGGDNLILSGDIVVAPDGSIYFTDMGNSRIRRFYPAD